MAVNADTTLIAQALATARSCARHAVANKHSTTSDFVMETMRQSLATFEEALDALKRIEAKDV